MIDGNKLWSCVGSAGIVDTGDIGKVVFAGSVAQLPGVVLQPPQPGTSAVVHPQTKAIIRYSVTPVDGVALQSSGIFCASSRAWAEALSVCGSCRFPS
jgi:hypothetical protein